MHVSSLLITGLMAFLFAGAVSAGCKAATYRCHDNNKLQICAAGGYWETTAKCNYNCCFTDGKDSLTGYCIC